MLSFTAYKRPTKPVGKLRDKTSVRRTRFLEQQAKGRKFFFEELREKALDALLSYSAGNDAKEDPSHLHSSIEHKSQKRSQFPSKSCPYLSNQLVIPDFLVDVPADLPTEWLAFLRPEGQRVVLIASGGHCCVFGKSGFFVESFPTALPPAGCTILDGVIVTTPSENNDNAWSYPLTLSDEVRGCFLLDEKVNEEQRRNDDESFEAEKDLGTAGSMSFKKMDEQENESKQHWISICDCICWNDCDMAESSAECRYFMLKSRFEEMQDALGTLSTTNGCSLRIVDIVEARSDELARLYYHSHSTQQIADSIIFVHKEAIYTPGISQLYLCWRDFSISRFPIDTSDPTGRSIPRHQQINLLLRLDDAAVLTEDRVVVARLDHNTLQAQLKALPRTIYLTKWMKGKIKTELLIRVSIEGLALEGLPDDIPDIKVDEVRATDLLIGMKIIGTPSPKRIRAETLNRIIHQFILRQTRIRLKNVGHSVPAIEDCADMPGQFEEFKYTGALLDFETILRCASTGDSHSRMLLLRGERNMEEFLEEHVCIDERLDDWC